ncbi:hypothetical protein [Cysteiniphilum sp. QT6929]|uniref:hypothetical protein n=1 Tax=Cysteiniphilum sp. QT6929 TaxID=2975055 RepID=UPI0024B32CEA|nr:hypothetical protein [Cysteiniphilum sp. QT6929]WHN66383.1 hypothetical protein NYP54_03910 [Cysteiniphilum sp. QT6929]
MQLLNHVKKAQLLSLIGLGLLLVGCGGGGDSRDASITTRGDLVADNYTFEIRSNIELAPGESGNIAAVIKSPFEVGYEVKIKTSTLINQLKIMLDSDSNIEISSGNCGEYVSLSECNLLVRALENKKSFSTKADYFGWSIERSFSAQKIEVKDERFLSHGIDLRQIDTNYKRRLNRQNFIGMLPYRAMIKRNDEGQTQLHLMAKALEDHFYIHLPNNDITSDHLSDYISNAFLNTEFRTWISECHLSVVDNAEQKQQLLGENATGSLVKVTTSDNNRYCRLNLNNIQGEVVTYYDNGKDKESLSKFYYHSSYNLPLDDNDNGEHIVKPVSE